MFFDPAMQILGIYPTNMLADLQNDMSTRLFIAVLFVTAIDWKLIGDSLNNLCLIPTMDYYTAIYKKRKEAFFVPIQNNIQDVFLSENKKVIPNTCIPYFFNSKICVFSLCNTFEIRMCYSQKHVII